MKTLDISFGAGMHVHLWTRDQEIDLNEFSSWAVFRIWMMEAVRHFTVDSIEVQSVDIVGKEDNRRILFAKFKADASDANGKVPGIVKLRGDVVGALVIGLMPDGSERVVKVVQPRFAIPSPATREIVAGMIDGGDPREKIAEEVEEETGVPVEAGDLVDLTALAFPGSPRGIALCPGSVDAHSLIYLARVVLDEDNLARLSGIHGAAGENERTRTELAPFDDAWRSMPDALSLCALFLYEKLRGQLPA